MGEEAYANTLSLDPGTSFVDADFVAALDLIGECAKRKLFNEGFMAIGSTDAMQAFLQGKFACHSLIVD